MLVRRCNFETKSSYKVSASRAHNPQEDASLALTVFLAVLSPLDVRRLLFVLARRHAKTTLIPLMLRGMSPVAAEMLTTRFEAADAADAADAAEEGSEGSAGSFYREFYAALESGGGVGGGEEDEEKEKEEEEDVGKGGHETFLSTLLDLKERFATETLAEACDGFLFSSTTTTTPRGRGSTDVVTGAGGAGAE